MRPAASEPPPSSSPRAGLRAGPTLLEIGSEGEQSRSSGSKCRAPDIKLLSTRSAMASTRSLPLIWITLLVHSPRFEGFIACIIVGNCLTMGLEAEAFITGGGSLLAVIAEHCFTALFVAELIMRVIVYGWRRFVPCLGGLAWDLVDLVLVLVTGVLPIWVLPLLGVTGHTMLRTLTVLRALRLIRLVRVIRVELFQEVWLLLRGMIESMRMLFWTIVVIAFITYIFAVFGVVLISVDVKDEYDKALAGDRPLDEARVEDLADLMVMTGGVMNFMFTLVQVLTLDSWTGLVRRLMKYSPLSWVFFYLYVAIGVIVLMNIVTAVLVDHAMMNSKKDAEELVASRDREKKQALRQFKRLFEAMDTDGSGGLSREEFVTAFAEPEMATKMRSMEIHPEDCEELFALLDGGDGVLSLEELFEGIQRMEGAAMAKDLFRVLKKTEYLARVVKESMQASRACSTTSLGAGGGQGQAAGPLLASARGAFLPSRGTCSRKLWDLQEEQEAPAEQRADSHGQGPRPFDTAVMERLESVTAAVTACNANVERCLAELAALRCVAAV